MEPTIMYEARDYTCEIYRVAADKATNDSVWICGAKKPRLSYSEGYFSTWAEARDWLIKRRKTELVAAMKYVDRAHADLDKALIVPEHEPES